ncbi:MAG: hypothetical protein GX776_05170 [Oxalobacter sp.]|nr:hypothetical protein [Oxalobacter sp.]
MEALGPENRAGEMGNQVAALLSHFGVSNKKLHQMGIPTVLVSHGTVNESMNESGVKMVDQDNEFTQGTLFAACADAVMLGHIHAFQSWENHFNNRCQMIAYAGSIGRFHYGEQGDKCFLVWDVESGNATFEKHVTPSKQMYDITFDGVPDMDELEALAKQCAGGYVRVRFTVDEEYASTVDRDAIEQILGTANVAGMKIEGKILPVQRQRAAGISSLGTVGQKFMEWCKVSKTPADGLSERVDQLLANQPEDIARQFIQGVRVKRDKSLIDAKSAEQPSLEELLL